MRYDRDGFPIPPEFDLPAPDRWTGARSAATDQAAAGSPGPPRRAAGAGKRRLIVLVALAFVLPALLLPVALPVVREGVVQWSLERALDREARGNPRAAIADVGRAIRWADDDRLHGRLLCWRAQLRIESGDARGAVADATRASKLAPTTALPYRVRALAHAVLQDPEAALVDAEAAVSVSNAADPEALNHRAYIRALVGRELPEALGDIEVAIGDAGAAASPEFLDTRGFILHLLGRHAEAVDDLNRAIGQMQMRRRQATLATGQADPVELARELRSLDQALAVMHQHRGLACKSLGLVEQARQDLEIAERKGYDPTRGIF
jgi:tetratricopeptide (TPR) repeat protein